MNGELKEKLIKLHKDCFNDGDYAEFFFEHRLPDGRAYVIEEDGEPLSACYARFFELVLEGKRLVVPFLTGVATSPLHRYKGLARKVVEKAKRELAAEGYPFVLLHPFNHDFYRKLGFETINYITRIEPSGESAAEVCFKQITEEELPLVSELYSTLIKANQSYRTRELGEIKLLIGTSLKNGSFGYIIYENGYPKGYVWCEDGNCTEALAERRELLYGCPVPAGYTLPVMGGYTDYSMGAVLCLEELFKAIPYLPSSGGAVRFALSDASYELNIKNGSFASLRKIASAEAALGERELIAICLGQGARVPGNPFKNIIPSYNLACYEIY